MIFLNDITNSSDTDIILLYGLAGAGKSYVGDLLGTEFGYYVYHADIDSTPEMKLAISEQQPFTMEMRDRFFEIVAEKILLLRKNHKKLVITQATYKKRHRDYLKTKIPGLKCVCIEADDNTIVTRLSSRGDLISPEYAKVLRQSFEAPDKDDFIFINS